MARVPITNRFLKDIYQDGPGGKYHAIRYGGTFPLAKLNDLGVEVLKTLIQFVGRMSKFRGYTRDSIWFKWDLTVQTNVDEMNILVFGDWLRERGYDVEVERGRSKMADQHEYLRLRLK